MVDFSLQPKTRETDVKPTMNNFRTEFILNILNVVWAYPTAARRFEQR